MKRKWAINSAFMAFYAFAAVLIIWVLYAYKMAFGEQWIPICGVPGNVLGINTLLNQADIPAAKITAAFPLATMVYFQFVFAAITLILLAGALLGRMNFLAWMVFVPLWLTFSYTIGAFTIWGGGVLFQMGVLDYSGGYVIHLSSGVAGFTAAAVVGPRLAADRLDDKPSNLGFVLIGAGILWVGWSGFNGGDPYTASPDAGVAVLNTNICTAMSVLVWTFLDVIFYKKPSLLGAVQGMITGLVAITPAAGFVAGWGAIIIGIFSGSVPWVTMNVAGKRLSIFRHVDDTLGIFHTHAVAGALGGFLTGVFAKSEGTAGFAATSPGGGITGNGTQVWLQIVGALFIIGWNVVVTALILYFIKFVLRIPLRMTDETLAIGDDAIHGEDAYKLDDLIPVVQGSRPGSIYRGKEGKKGSEVSAQEVE
jgi:Amt family ammonium transporter